MVHSWKPMDTKELVAIVRHIDFIAFTPEMNLRPTLKPSFFAACRVPSISLTLSARLCFSRWLKFFSSEGTFLAQRVIMDVYVEAAMDQTAGRRVER